MMDRKMTSKATYADLFRFKIYCEEKGSEANLGSMVQTVSKVYPNSAIPHI